MLLKTVQRFLPLGVTLAVFPSCYLFCPYNADQFVETQIRAECHFWFSCCTAGEHELAATSGRGGFLADMDRFKDEGACVQERLEEGTEANEFVRGVVQAEQAGRFKFDAATWQLCQQPLIDALNNCNADFILGDGAPLEVPEECRDIPPGVGLVANEGECFFDYECATPGSDCLPPEVLEKFDPDAEPDEPTEILITQPKICIAPIKKGDSCEVDEDFPLLPPTCEPGAICFTDSDGDQTCEDPHQDGDDCNTSADCDAGLFCDVAANGGPECAELKGEGDECAAEVECDIGLTCDLLDDLECEADLPVNVEICNGVNGQPDPVYPAGG